MSKWPSCLLLLTVGILSANPCGAQSDKPVTITISFTRIHDRLGPNGHSGIHVRISGIVTLSGTNTVDETWNRQSGNFSKRATATSTLGSGTWHVADADTLVKTNEEPHSTTTITIHVSGDKCEAKVSASLKPGFTNFVFSRLDTGDMATFSAPHFADELCSIR